MPSRRTSSIVCRTASLRIARRSDTITICARDPRSFGISPFRRTILAGSEREAGYFSSYMRTGRIIHHYQGTLADQNLKGMNFKYEPSIIAHMSGVRRFLLCVI